MKKIVSIALLGLIIISACSSGFHVSEKEISSSPKITQFTSSRIKIKGDGINDYDKAYIQFFCSKADTGTTYQFSIDYYGPQWIGLEKISLDVDGIESILIPNRPPKLNEKGFEGLNELIFVSVPKSTITDMIEIGDTKLKLVGKFKTIEIYFKSAWIDNLALFYDKTRA